MNSRNTNQLDINAKKKEAMRKLREDRIRNGFVETNIWVPAESRTRLQEFARRLRDLCAREFVRERNKD